MYLREPDQAFSPAEVVWKYGSRAGHEGSFYCTHISAVQRLPNGNTLITQGPQATLIEVTPEGQEVWRWLSPVVADKKDPQALLSFVRQGDPRPINVCHLFRTFKYAREYPGPKHLETMNTAQPAFSLHCSAHLAGRSSSLTFL